MIIRLPYLNDNITWYAEKIFLDNYTLIIIMYSEIFI